jgi:hypothetical protein
MASIIHSKKRPGVGHPYLLSADAISYWPVLVDSST